MRKFFFLLLILLYGWGASGATLYLHYCCGRLANVEWESRNSSNDHCHDQHVIKKSCCTEDVLASTVRDAHLAQNMVFGLQTPMECLPPSWQWYLQTEVLAIQASKGVQEIYAPPPLLRVDRSLLCIYRI